VLRRCHLMAGQCGLFSFGAAGARAMRWARCCGHPLAAPLGTRTRLIRRRQTPRSIRRNLTMRYRNPLRSGSGSEPIHQRTRSFPFWKNRAPPSREKSAHASRRRDALRGTLDFSIGPSVAICHRISLYVLRTRLNDKLAVNFASEASIVAAR